ncbi:MAG: hypothetical protein ACM3OO_05300 [Planctomycetaceae bacterium]
MPSIDDDVAALYALPPDGFTAARDRLAADLRAGGDPDGAKAVKALRRPTLVAWAVNAAARARPDAVARLLDAGARLEEAQRQALAGRGGATDLRTAADDRREAVRSLTEAADQALESAGKAPAAHRDAVASTFEAASVDPALALRLRTATVEREARPLPGLGGFEGLTVVPGSASSRTASERGARTPRDPAARRKALEADVRAAAESARAAAAKADGADAAAARAPARATAARASADKAVAAADAAEAEARRLREVAATERRRAAKVAEAATKALGALDDLGP